MKQTVNSTAMIQYLQELMDAYKEEEQMFNEWAANREFKLEDVTVYGKTDSARRQMRNMIACKEMVEALIGEPVNLRKDGKVTVGF